jgi:hypothetical protein
MKNPRIMSKKPRRSNPEVVAWTIFQKEAQSAGRKRNGKKKNAIKIPSCRREDRTESRPFSR